MAEVELIHLSKRFRDVVAVDDVSLTIRDRELLVLVGPSGSGKTTTLRMIAGLDDPSGGEIRIAGRCVNRVAPKDRDIAMVFQSYALYPHMNVRQNMSFGLRMRRTPRAEIDRRVADAARLLGIEDLLDRKPAQLSGGQRQRVAVGRAIVRNPAVFLLDEPLSNLDARLRVAMRSELVKLQKRLATTMVYVTHDQVEAMMMGDRIVVMHEGRIQQVGEPMDVYEFPANRFVAQFIGSPPMNAVPVTVRSSSNEVGGASRWSMEFRAVDSDASRVNSTWQVPLPEDRFDLSKHAGRRVVFGIRPEDLQIHSDESRRGDGPIRADEEATREATNGIPAEVVISQPLGAETIVDLSSAVGELVARAPASARWERGAPVRLNWSASRIHLFDADDGRSLRRPDRDPI